VNSKLIYRNFFEVIERKAFAGHGADHAGERPNPQPAHISEYLAAGRHPKSAAC